MPREALYCWYARHGGAKADVEFAMTKSLKLYRDGTCFDLRADPFEAKPLSVADLPPRDAEAVKMLQTELDRYLEARPEKLRKPPARSNTGE